MLHIRETNFNLRSTDFFILYSEARQNDIWEDNIKIFIDEIVEKGVDWTGLKWLRMGRSCEIL